MSNGSPNSVLDAIRMGCWNYEPGETDGRDFTSTEAMPGTEQKVEILAQRVRRGLPLWHPSDRRCFDDRD